MGAVDRAARGSHQRPAMTRHATFPDVTMAVWKFQLYPAQPDRIGPRFAMDEPAEAFELKVNDALRYPFGFHKVNKLCVCLGPSLESRPHYKEALGVGDVHCADFSFERYVAQSTDGRTLELERVTKNVFAWLVANFDDANFVLVAARNLGWTEFPPPQLRLPRRTT